MINAFKALPESYRQAVRRMVEDYAGLFGGREAELATLDRFLEQEEQPYAFLLAPTGRGKTALLIRWLERVEQAGVWTSVFMPISRRYQTAGASATLGALAGALASFFGKTVQYQSMAPSQLKPLIAEYLHRPAPPGRKLLVVLDGLDEAVGWTPGAELFPRVPGAGIRIVASARQLAHQALPEWLARLGWPAGRTTALELSSLSAMAVHQLLDGAMDPQGRPLEQPELIAEVLRLSEGDPLT